VPVTPAPPRFGRYTLLRPIGRGGMGAVYEAEHVHLGKRVALKTLHAPALAEAESVARFLREGRAAARVRHPHVVDVTDVGVEDGVPYLVMELLDGEDLAAKLRREAPLPVTEALDLLLPVMAAVDAMHAAGVVHRDLKPENLFLARALGRVVPKVLDFGVARPDDAPRAASSRGDLVGTPFYLSPEQVDGARGDARSDQHALAVVLYECLCGRRPYDAPTLLGLLATIREGRRDDPRALRPDLPAGLCAALAVAMNPLPSQRFARVRDFAEALLPDASPRAREAWESAVERPVLPLAPAPPDDAPPPMGVETRRDGSPAPPTPQPRPRSVRAAVVSAALLSLAVLVGIAARRPPPPAVTVLAPAPSLPLPPARTVVVAAVSAPRAAPALPAPTRVRARGTSPVRAALREPPREPTIAPSGPPPRPVINGAPIVD
jgi:eukaryotic-like serine/threonine-protein kinase